MTQNRMFTALLILSLGLTLSCNTPGNNESDWPDELSGKKTLLTEKKKSLREIQADIDKLEKEIAELNPSLNGNITLVRTKELTVEPFKHYVEIQSNVESDDAVMVSAEVGGRIKALPVEEGQYLRKGQVVAELNLESINKQIQEVKTSLDLANTVYERQKRLWEKNIGSEMQYLEAKNNKERLEKTLETLEFELSKSTVHAPISGEVDQLFAKSGEMVAPGTPILQLINTSKVKVIAEVPENYLNKVTQGDEVLVQFPALDMQRQATISRIGASINPNNRTFEVEVMLSNPDRILKPNLLGTMLIKDYENPEAITVPVELVQEEVNGRDYVFVVDEGKDDIKAKKVYVETGLTFEGNMEIKSGLTGDETLITDGARILSNNDPIEIRPSSTAETERNGQ